MPRFESEFDFKLCETRKGTEAIEGKSLGSQILSILPILSFCVGCAGVRLLIMRYLDDPNPSWINASCPPHPPHPQ
jgi:hypothetical protein